MIYFSIKIYLLFYIFSLLELFHSFISLTLYYISRCMVSIHFHTKFAICVNTGFAFIGITFAVFSIMFGTAAFATNSIIFAFLCYKPIFATVCTSDRTIIIVHSAAVPSNIYFFVGHRNVIRIWGYLKHQIEPFR